MSTGSILLKNVKPPPY